ncbi:MAG: GMC family oxidoreductase [Bacteroidales bacterium]|nr:GMC family oxidoreductase [Bacteroidales bacterium]
MIKMINSGMQYDFDYIIVGSGFGGSVSAMRLTEKGYRVLVIEKGKRWLPDQFPETNWKLRRWLWMPLFRFRGIFKITIMRHVGILSGVGVGGGSLMYANTLPRPRETFFQSGSWAGIADWKSDLEPHYTEAERMLGATENPGLYDSDEALGNVAARFGKSDQFEPTRVAVFFGEPEQEVPDPFFDGEGPRRSGCNMCGGCMTGCRYNAKNTLDKNYLYLAEKEGAEVLAEKKVIGVEPLTDSVSGEPDTGEEGSRGYRVILKDSTGLYKKRTRFTTRNVILAGGVLGTVRLLLNLRRSSLPAISDQLGAQIRTNNESLALVHSGQKEKDFSKGVAIGSIFPPDKDSHIEPVRYASGSGFWKLMGVPMVHGKSVLGRIMKLIWSFISRPLPWLRIYFSRDFARESVILLFMQHIDSTLRLKRGLINMRSTLSSGPAPSASMPLARELADATSEEVEGHPFVMVTEAVLGTPLTAHILGGCVIGKDSTEGVIDQDHKVFGYENLYVCDGSAISANPGVNPALTITAMTERAMSKIPNKE